MKKNNQKEFEVNYTTTISHRVLVYAENEEEAKYKVLDDESLPLRKSQVTETNISSIVQRQNT